MIFAGGGCEHRHTTQRTENNRKTIKYDGETIFILFFVRSVALLSLLLPEAIIADVRLVVSVGVLALTHRQHLARGHKTASNQNGRRTPKRTHFYT